ncbi:MAG: regulatory protein GemA [Xanthomonadaceae bacterium]|jgi:phage gp16-like protein|nr:regulatory protein GemA [Xanthomonadaceae bacterium]
MARQRATIGPGKMRLQTIRAIQAMRRKLDLDDGAYRDLVERNSALHGPAVRSAGDCNQAQLDAVAGELRMKLGQPAKGGWKGKPKAPPLSREAQTSKIEALLADQGREWEYAHALARRICKVERLEFCRRSDLQRIIAALEYDARRHPERSRTGYKQEPRA